MIATNTLQDASVPDRNACLDEIEIVAYHVADLARLAKDCVEQLYKISNSQEAIAYLGKLDALTFVTADMAKKVAVGIAETPRR